MCRTGFTGLTGGKGLDQYAEETVAVLLASYNGERYIERQLKSISEQTHRKFICYIHDDGSTDNTSAILQRFAATDSRFRIVDGKPTGGAKNNFMFLLGFAHEAYIMFCDQDDIWVPTKIEEELSEIKRLEAIHGTVPISVFCNLKIAAADGKEIHPDFMKYSGYQTGDLSYQRLLVGNIVPGCTMILNKTLRDLAVRCSDTDLIMMHDWWCIAIASLYGVVSFLDRKLIYYCQHEGQALGAGMKDTPINRIRKVMDLLKSGKLGYSKKEWGNNVYRQIRELMNLGDMDPDRKAELEKMLSMKKKNRITKMAYFAGSQWGNRKQRAWLCMWY